MTSIISSYRRLRGALLCRGCDFGFALYAPRRPTERCRDTFGPHWLTAPSARSSLSTFRNEVQVVITVLALDEEDPDQVAVNAASLALATSDIPWGGPVAAVRIGQKSSEQFIINPSYQERAEGSSRHFGVRKRRHYYMIEGRRERGRRRHNCQRVLLNRLKNITRFLFGSKK